MNYPLEFSNKARAAVEAELIRAGRLHEARKQNWQSEGSSFPERKSLATNVLSVFLTYAQEAIELGKSGIWAVDRVRQETLEGLRLITIDVTSGTDFHGLDRYRGFHGAEFEKEYKQTPEWRKFEDELLALAEQHAAKVSERHAQLAKRPIDREDPGTEFTIEVFPSLSFIPGKLVEDVEEIVDSHNASIRQAILEVLSALRSSAHTQVSSGLIFDAVAKMGTELFEAALHRMNWIDEYNPPDTYERVADDLYQDALAFVKKKYESVVSEIPGLSAQCEPALLDELRTNWLQIREEAKRDVHKLSMVLREMDAEAARGFDIQAQHPPPHVAGQRESDALGVPTQPDQSVSEYDQNVDPEGASETVREINVALEGGDRKRAVRLRCHLDRCSIKELWSEAFSKRAGKDKTKRTAFNRWQAARRDTPSWADELMRGRLLRK